MKCIAPNLELKIVNTEEYAVAYSIFLLLSRRNLDFGSNISPTLESILLIPFIT